MENLEPSSHSGITARVTRSQARTRESLNSPSAVNMAGDAFQQATSIMAAAAAAASTLRKVGKPALATKNPASASHAPSSGLDKTSGTASGAAGDGEDREYDDPKERIRQPPPSKNGLLDKTSGSDNEDEDGENFGQSRRNRKSSPPKDYFLDALVEDENEDGGTIMVVDDDNGSEGILPALGDIDNDLALVLHQSVDDDNPNHSVGDQTHVVAASYSPPRSAGAGVFDTSELYARILDLDNQAVVMSTQLAATTELLKRQQTNLEKHGDRIDRHENHLIEARKDIEIHNKNLEKQLDINKAKVDMMNNLINLKLGQGKGKRGRDVDNEDEGYDFAPRKKHLTQAQASHLRMPQEKTRAKQAYGFPQRRSRSPQPSRRQSLKAITEPGYDEESDTSGSSVDVVSPLFKERLKQEDASCKETPPSSGPTSGIRPALARKLIPPPRTAVADCDGQDVAARHADIAGACHAAAARRAEAARRTEFDYLSDDPYSSLTAAPGIINPSPARILGRAGHPPASAQDPTTSKPVRGVARSLMPPPTPPRPTSASQQVLQAQRGEIRGGQRRQSGRRKVSTVPKHLSG